MENRSESKANLSQEEEKSTKDETSKTEMSTVCSTRSSITVRTALSGGVNGKVKRLYGPSDMVKVFAPVSITMFIVIICVRNFDIYHGQNLIPTPYVIYNEPHAEPTTEFLHALINAVAFLAVIIISTFILLCLFYYKFYCLLSGFIMVSTFLLVSLFSFMQYQQILSDLNVPISIIAMIFLHMNLAVIELMSIFWKGPMKLQQASLILISVTVTLTIMQILPRWTSWTLLVTLALWDLFAVLSPCGPLKLLVETAEERGEDLMPAIIYSTVCYFFPMTAGAASVLQSDSVEPHNSSNVKKSTPVQDKVKSTPSRRFVESIRMPSLHSDDDERNIRLGLGDFIFYSLLVGTASVHGDWTMTIACFVSILTGLGFTLVLLVILQKALPALPISVAFGVIAYFSSRFAMSKLVLEFNRKQIFV